MNVKGQAKKVKGQSDLQVQVSCNEQIESLTMGILMGGGFKSIIKLIKGLKLKIVGSRINQISLKN